MKFLVVVLAYVQYVVVIIDQEGLFRLCALESSLWSHLWDHFYGRISLGEGETCQT